jgi:hypothetical protein
VLAFLDAQLKQDASALQGLVDASRGKVLGPEPHLERVPKGTTAPEPYATAATEPPSPRQVRPLLAASGADATVEILRRWHVTRADAPIYEPVFGFALVYELLERGQESDGKKIGLLYRELVPSFLEHFTAIGDLYARRGSKEFAAKCFTKALAIDPENADARSRLDQLTSAGR